MLTCVNIASYSICKMTYNLFPITSRLYTLWYRNIESVSGLVENKHCTRLIS